ncbi:MAG: hypothetical protein JNK64_24520 [Myxococcales bacterium]|nr:hypothetical protein [Myxococcales bacterium]
MSPYRDPPPPAAPAHDRVDDDAIGVVLIGIGLVPVIATAVAGARFGAEATIGLTLAAIGVASRWRRR